MASIIKNIKEMVGISESEENIEQHESPIISDEETKSVKSFFGRGKENKSDDKENETQTEAVGVTDVTGYQSIIIKPEKFEDCKKIANYIKNDKTVTLNLENLDEKKAQRIIDFLSGAMSIKEAKFIEISKFVYTSVPKNINVYIDAKNDAKDSFYEF